MKRRYRATGRKELLLQWCCGFFIILVRMRSSIFLSLFFAFACNAQQHRIVDTSPTVSPKINEVRLISDRFRFTEGPVADKQGRIFFTDQPNDQIWIYDPQADSVWLFLEGTGRANGLDIDAEGHLIACADEQGQLLQISPDGEKRVLLNQIDGKRMNGPNDLWIDDKGGIYFTDPFYKRSYWAHQDQPVETEGIYYLPPGEGNAVAVDTALKKSNGIIGTPDNQALYVADIGDNKTYRYTINADGSLSNKTLFVQQGSDGMTLDKKGNLYLTGNGITIYNPHGKKIGEIAVPAPWTANGAFAGRNSNLLFITAGKGIYIVELQF